MLTVSFQNAHCENKSISYHELPVTGQVIIHDLEKKIGNKLSSFFLVLNGKLIKETDILYDGSVSIIPKFFGGKGGFGSMLRAIGAQIEKTTNREACRDLSGRRLRDINEEKRLKSWLEKQKNREEEANEKKKKKIEKLCAEPKHEFKDKSYEQQRSELTERVEDAVEQGFKLAGSSGLKRASDSDTNPKKKKKILLDFDDIDSDDLESSDDDSSNEKEKNASISNQPDIESDSNLSVKSKISLSVEEASR